MLLTDCPWGDRASPLPPSMRGAVLLFPSRTGRIGKGCSEVAARILIVDDEENQRRALSIALGLEGFVVEEAADGEEAMRRLEGGHFDLAIVDLMMPGINGLDLARRLRFRWPNLRVVLTSAYHLSERQLARADVGAIAFVPKPYRFDDLVGFIHEKLGAAAAAAN
jgi:CheY-like chemotaxis protein